MLNKSSVCHYLLIVWFALATTCATITTTTIAKEPTTANQTPTHLPKHPPTELASKCSQQTAVAFWPRLVCIRPAAKLNCLN